MIESGRRNADRFRGDLFVAYVRQSGLSSQDQMALDRNLTLAHNNGAEIKVLENQNPVRAIIAFAREAGITQIFIGHSMQAGWIQTFKKTIVEQLIELAEGIDVRIFPQ